MVDTDELNVWYEQQLVGFLWKNDLDRMGFRYDKGWLENELGFPISVQLPLQELEYSPDQGIAHRFFANLLPEGQARTSIVNSLKIPNSDFALVKAIGGECAGALSILPYNASPLSPDDWQYELLTTDKLSQLIKRRGPIYSFSKKTRVQVRLSLAGAQDKLPILIKNGEFFLPQNEAPTSHILKFTVTGLSHVPAYETVLTMLARKINLPVVEMKLQTLTGLPTERPDDSFVVIKRYDRVVDEEGKIRRLHQEDFCQALGYGYDKKYQGQGGPTFAECLNLLREQSDEPAIDSELLLQWHSFNWLAGNSDGHAKNISLLSREQNSRQLSPFYDLVCTRAIDHIDVTLAFAIGGQLDPGQIKRENWEAFAQECDTNRNYLIGLVKDQAENILEMLPLALDEFNDQYGEYKALQRVEKVISKQCKNALRDV